MDNVGQAPLFIVLVDSSFDAKGQQEQNAAISELQIRAASAGLAGNVVPVWDSGGGKMSFVAPMNQHAFFTSITPQYIAANINKELYW
jgi:hypothetical protein